MLVIMSLMGSGCGIGSGGKTPGADISRQDTLTIATTYQQYDFVPVNDFNFFTNPSVLQVDGANRTIYEQLMYLDYLLLELHLFHLLKDKY